MRDGPVEAGEVTEFLGDLQGLAGRLDPDHIPDEDISSLLVDLGQAKRLIDGMVTLIARRTWEANPDATGAIATATGTTLAEAKRVMDTSVRLAEQPEIADAVRDGRLSAAQSVAVADAVEADPDAGAQLLDAAARQTVHDLKRTCRDVKVAADPDSAATRRRHHRDRGFRSWTASDGEWKAFMSGPADVGARIDAAIRSQHDQIFKTAHAEGHREDDKTYRLDALVATLETQPNQAGYTTARQTKVIVTVDVAALKRGHAEPDETCQIAGIGRVSVAAVNDLFPSAHIAYVIRDAVDASVVHLGRQVTAHQRTALEARGYECEVPDCRTSHLLEIDHVTDWAFSRTTKLDQLAWLCRHHHRQKTGRTHRLTGPPGSRQWTAGAEPAAGQRPTPARQPGTPPRQDSRPRWLRQLGEPPSEPDLQVRGWTIRPCPKIRRQPCARRRQQIAAAGWTRRAGPSAARP